MNNDNLWFEVLKRLKTISDYQAGAVVELPDGDRRFYHWGKWLDLSFAALCPIHLSLSDIFPDNPDKESK